MKTIKQQVLEEISLEKQSGVGYNLFRNKVGEAIDLTLAKVEEMVEDFDNSLISMSRHPDARAEIDRVRGMTKELLVKIKGGTS